MVYPIDDREGDHLTGNNDNPFLLNDPSAIEKNVEYDPETGRFIWTWPCARALIFSGAVAGFLSGLLGVGGGFVLVPALQRFTNLTVQSITVTSLAVIAIVSTFGVLNSIGAGAFNYEIGITFSAAALTGMLTGRLVSNKLPSAHLKKAFGVMCIVVAALMLIKNL